MDMDFKRFEKSLAAVRGGSASKINFEIGTDTVAINRNKNGAVFIKILGSSFKCLKLLTQIGERIQGQGFNIVLSVDKKYRVPLLILNPLPAAKEVAPDE